MNKEKTSILKMLDLIKSDVYKVLLNNPKQTISDVKKSISNTLRQNIDKEVIENYHINKCTTLWKKWSLKQKIIWIWKTILGFGKKEKDSFLDMQDFLISRAVDESDDFKEKISQIVDEHYKKYYKEWMERFPKAVVDIDISIRTFNSIEYVEINGQLEL